MNMKKDLVSIVIPVYNGENYIRDAVNSALAQTYGNFEVIVVNDGSTDNTEEICSEFGNSIRYFRKENGGVSTALNLGIRKMNGEYFTWLAHDDIFYPQKVSLQMSAIKISDDKTQIVYGNYDLLNIKSSTVSHMRQEESYTPSQLTNSVFPLLMTCIHACTALIHKSNFERVGLFDENLPLTQDYDLLFKMFRNNKTIFLPDSLLVSRLHKDSGKNINNKFSLACAEQYKHFAEMLSYDELKSLFVSPKAFYARTAAMCFARNCNEIASGIIEKSRSLPRESFSKKPLVEKILQLSGGIEIGICIFGAGFHGKVLNFELKCREINVDYFCDENFDYYGKTIDGVECISIEELKSKGENLLVIVAADISEEILNQLSALSLPYITTKKALDNAILSCTPIL